MTRRLSVTLNDADRAKLQDRANAHRMPLAAYLRAAALNDPTDPRGTARAADAWWETLPPERRDQIHRWVTGRHAIPPQPDRQASIDDLIPE